MDPLSLVGQRSFAAYGPSHWAVLVLVTAGAGVLVWSGTRYRGTRTAWVTGRVFAVVLVAVHVPILIYDLFPARFDIEYSLPLHISDITWIAASCALWFRWQWAFALTYYWAFTLIPQAMITPGSGGADFPSYDFISFWVRYLLVVWAAVYLVSWLGMRPNWAGFGFAAAVTVGWGVVVFSFNEMAGTNYMFLNRKPDNPSLLDLMGDWPWYLAVALAIGLAAWALMTWPFARHREPDSARTAARR